MRVAIGIREHSGWGVLIAVSTGDAAPVLAIRRRIILLSNGLPGQPFHAAAGMQLDEARTLVRAAAESARDCARAAIEDVQAELRVAGHDVAACGVGIGMNPITAPFERVMASHALLHASEGDMYRDAVADAADDLGLPVSRAPWREVWSQLGVELGVTPDGLRERVTDMRAAVGAPWGSDQKEACAAAWLALLREGRAH